MARLVALAFTLALAAGQTTSGVTGQWTLSRSQSQFPKELGFNVDWIPRLSADGQPAPPPAPPRRESYEEGQRKRLLTEEARNPPLRLLIVDNTVAVTIANELGQSRTFHPNGREEPIDIQGVPATVTAARDGDRLIVTYHVAEARDVRITYTPWASPARLVVESQFLEEGKGDKVTRVYEPGAGSDVVSAARPAAAPPAPDAAARETFDQRPGAEFRGLKDVGILVEDLGGEAIGCGLRRDVLEDALARRLTAGGLRVRKNSDEDTYVYANVITTAMPNGTCVSRYDAFLYTHTTARLAYHDQPVLVQVSLIHRGGIGTSAIATHPAAVLHGLEGYVDVFLAQIRDANK